MTDSADLEARLRSLSIVRSGDAGAATPATDTTAHKPARSRRRRRVWPSLLFGPIIGAAVALVALPDLRAEVTAQVMPHVAPYLERFEAQAATPIPQAAPEAVAAADAPATAAATDQVAQPAPQPAPVIPTIVGSGYVTAPRSIVVQSEIAGRVSDIQVAVGDRLVAGDALLTLDRSEAELDRATAMADLSLARARVESAEADRAALQAVFERQEALFKRGAGRGADLDDSRLQLVGLAHAIEIAKAQRDSAELTLRRADMKLEKHVLRAPFDAVVVDLPASQGMLISSGEAGGVDRAGLMTLMDVSRLYVDVDVSEQNIAHIQPGQAAEVRLDAFPDRTTLAQVSAIDPRASRDKATVTVRLLLDDQDLEGVRPDMSAKATFSTASDRALALLHINRSN